MFDGVQPGDKVLLVDHRGNVYERIVLRVGLDRIRVDGASWTLNGDLIDGSSWDTSRIERFDQDRLDAYRKKHGGS